MSKEKCEQCNGAGEQTFHKGTARECRMKCPDCRGSGLKNDKSKELVKISLEV